MRLRKVTNKCRFPIVDWQLVLGRTGNRKSAIDNWQSDTHPLPHHLAGHSPHNVSSPDVRAFAFMLELQLEYSDEAKFILSV